MKKISEISEAIVANNLEDLGDVQEFAITREGFTIYTNELLKLGTKTGFKQGLCVGVGLSVCAYLYVKGIKD